MATFTTSQQTTQKVSNIDALNITTALIASDFLVGGGGSGGTITGGTGGTGGTGSAGGTTFSGQPPATLDDIELLLTSIPVAEDGNVIRSQHLNSMRGAIIALASMLGVDPSGRTVPLTFSPAFLPDGTKQPWVLSPGVAVKAGAPLTGQTKVDADGWMHIDLPHNSTIEGLTATGKRTGTVFSFRVNLLRQSVSDPDQSPITLASLSLTTAEENFTRTTTVQVSGISGGAAVTAAALEDAKRVDNSVYKYVISARLVDADPTAVVQLNSIQVLCKR